jgi:isopentenyl diphosphate isomerase/L-lactate dehydrogenase-like FMN-dependent dehydrogenase
MSGDGSMSSGGEQRFQTLHEIVKAARINLNQNFWDYLIGGAESETTVRRNRQALDSVAFRPRVLRDTSEIDLTGKIFGKALRIPVIVAPVGSLQSFEPGGGATVAQAVEEFGAGLCLSSVTEPGLEAAAAQAPNALKIFQLYVRGDNDWVDDYARRAVASGYDAFCITVDTAHYSRRERDTAKRFVKTWRTYNTGMNFQAAHDWDNVKHFKDTHDIPLILKGIATAEDAALAIEHGVNGIYVSNHGGRQLDHGRGALEMLPEIVAAVDGRAKIIFDSGISRGTDIIKAIALGADLVGIGRLYCYGLAAAGRAGVVRVFELLEAELATSMGLLGVTNFAALDKSYLHAASPVVPPSVHSAFLPLLRLPEEGY